MKLHGAQVVVVGASSGMGLATARRAVDEGAVVTIVARNADRLEEARESLGGTVMTAVADAADEDQIEAGFEPLAPGGHAVIFAGEKPGSALAGAKLDLFRRAVE